MTLTQIDDIEARRRSMDDDKYDEKLMNQSVARIKLTDKEEEADDDEDDFEEEMDEDVWHRKQVKYNSEQILEKQQTKKQEEGQVCEEGGGVSSQSGLGCRRNLLLRLHPFCS